VLVGNDGDVEIEVVVAGRSNRSRAEVGGEAGARAGSDAVSAGRGVGSDVGIEVGAIGVDGGIADTAIALVARGSGDVLRRAVGVGIDREDVGAGGGGGDTEGEAAAELIDSADLDAIRQVNVAA
jgi:hypothetical protein